GLAAKTSWVLAESLKEPFPAIVNIAVPVLPVRSLSPVKIVDSAGAAEPFTDTSPDALREPSGCRSCGLAAPLTSTGTDSTKISSWTNARMHGEVPFTAPSPNRRYDWAGTAFLP